MIGPILAAERRSFINGFRTPGRRGLLTISLSVVLAMAIFGAYRMTGLFLAWRAAGLLASRLWWIVLAAWAAAGGMGALALREQATGDRARLLFTLPFSPAERARALFAAAAAQLVNLWLLSLGSLGSALLVALGIQAWPWIAVILLGQGVVLVGTGLALALAAALSPARLGWIATAALTGGGLAVALLRRVSAPPSPGVVAALSAFLLLLALGPSAGALGRLYERAFQAILSAGPRPRRHRVIHFLGRGLARRRTLAAAFLHRSLLSRGRQWIDGARLVLAASALVIFPRLRPMLAAHGLSDVLTLSGTVALLGFLLLVDGSSSPLGAEGSRLALLLTAPISPASLLRAKLAALSGPLLLGGIVAAVLLGNLCGTGARETAVAALASALLLLGLATLFTWGSAWDADLDLEIEGGLRGLLQEQTPLTPVRALLVGLGSALLATDLLALRALPPALALATLAGLDLLVLGLAWRAGLAGLRRLVRVR